MKLDQASHQSRLRILKMKMEIQEVIDKSCVSNEFQTSYSEIYMALTECLRDNLFQELKASREESRD